MLRVAVRRLARRVPNAPRPPVAAPGASAAKAGLERAPAPLPAPKDPWSEVKDASSGQVYWWNKDTNETTALGAPKPGPDPWQEVRDASGQVYYWNKQTNETTAIGAPRPTAAAAAAQPQGGMTGGGLGGALADGMAWGVGTSIASRAMDGVLGPRSMEVVHRDETGGAAGGAAGGDAMPPAPGQGGDFGAAGGGGGDMNSQGWSWGDDQAGSGGGGAEDAGGDEGGGVLGDLAGWFGGGDGGW